MNYKRVYMAIIRKRKENPLPHGIGTEVHHIIPRSLGGSDKPENLVRLSSREHFIVHALLVKMFGKRHQVPVLRQKDGTALSKMYAAFHFMRQSNQHQQRYCNSRLYQNIRQNYQESAQQYSREQLSDMFAYYCKHDCGKDKEAFKRFQERFGYPYQAHSLRRLFLNRGFSLMEHKTFTPDEVRRMYAYYCTIAPIIRSGKTDLKERSFNALKSKFGFKGGVRNLCKLFEKHGLSVEQGLNRHFHKMFEEYRKNRVKYQNDFSTFCSKFNYPFSKRTLWQSFRRMGLNTELLH